MSLQLYNDGKAQKLEAATLCQDGSCRQYADSGKHVTVVYTTPQNPSPLRAETTRPVPVLLKAYLPDTAVSPAAATERLAVDVRRFLAGSNLTAMTQPYSAQ
jgi:exosortase J